MSLRQLTEINQTILTINVAAFAISAPHVSAIISRVKAFVPTSIPLLTKIKRGKLLMSSEGRKTRSVSLRID